MSHGIHFLVIGVVAIYMLEKCKEFRCAKLPGAFCGVAFLAGILVALRGTLFELQGDEESATQMSHLTTLIVLSAMAINASCSLLLAKKREPRQISAPFQVQRG